MSSIEHITHDVTSTVRGVVAHGVNCQGVMGSGVAKAIRAKWVKAYDRYRAFVTSRSTTPSSAFLGLAQLVNVGDPLIDEPNSLFVANLFTQDQYGKDGKVYANVDAIERSLDKAMEFCSGAELPLYMPLIGCGLGGLNWSNDVEPIVKRLQAKHGIQVYICTQ